MSNPSPRSALRVALAARGWTNCRSGAGFGPGRAPRPTMTSQTQDRGGRRPATDPARRRHRRDRHAEPAQTGRAPALGQVSRQRSAGARIYAGRLQFDPRRLRANNGEPTAISVPAALPDLPGVAHRGAPGRPAPGLEADHAEDRNVARAPSGLPGGLCAIHQRPATAKVVRANIHPVKVGAGGTALDTLVQLQQALNSPPPWLARAMGVEAGSLAKFVAAAEDAET